MKTVLNFFIFLRKDFTITKMLKTLTREQKLKNAPKKTSMEKNSPLFACLHFCAFTRVSL